MTDYWDAQKFVWVTLEFGSASCNKIFGNVKGHSKIHTFGPDGSQKLRQVKTCFAVPNRPKFLSNVITDD